MVYSLMLMKRSLEKLRLLPDAFRDPKLCSDCFTDRGLALEAWKVGRHSRRACPWCKSRSGAKLSRDAIYGLAVNFFQHGSFVKTEFGGASQLRLFERMRNDQEVSFPEWLQADVRLIEDKLGMAIDYYGPPTWRVREIEPLKALEDARTQPAAAHDAVGRFPHRVLTAGVTFYRLRKGLEFGKETEASQYDAPPSGVGGAGRLDDVDFPVLYGSQDLEICVHECRVTRADACRLATLKVARSLKLLDLCAETIVDGPTPFESVYLAVQFIFAAERHSYGIARAIAKAASSAGLDGIAYPSYFSSVRGDRIPNIGLFGHPIVDGRVELLCANRLLLNRVQYGVTLGPCLVD